MPNLINNAADLKKNFGSLSLQFTWANVSSFAEDAERDIIGEAIGPEALAYFQNNLGGLQDNPLMTLVYLQRSVSYLTILRWSQTALFQFEDKALYLAKTTTGAIPSDKKLNDLRRHCEEEGFKFLDKALELMENNLDEFPAYAGSATRMAINQGFIKTAVDFSKQRNINNSRLSFLSMFYFMIDIQEDKIPDVLTPVYYDLFKERFKDDDLSPDELKLLPFIKKAIAMHTIAAACRQLPVQFTAGGLFINRFNNSIDYAMKDPADQSRLQYLADDHCEKGDSFLIKLQAKVDELGAANLLPGYVATVVDDVQVNDKDSGLYQF